MLVNDMQIKERLKNHFYILFNEFPTDNLALKLENSESKNHSFFHKITENETEAISKG